MFVELHVLQNFAPSNLNRDDTNAPKECEFGGHRRARISSQCLKRAIRTSFKDQRLLDKDDLAVRTKRLVDALVKRLELQGRDPEEARAVVQTALGGVGLKVDDKDQLTQYLLYLGEREVAGLAEVCDQQWDAIAAIAPTTEATSGKAAKKQGKAAVPTEVTKALNAVLDGGRAADLALFGRMLADRPGLNINAASQVAHAISTNRVAMEFDFFTAVDDLNPEDSAGAGMLGTTEFNSACFYRYANVDVKQLRSNLGQDEGLLRRTIEAFIRASKEAIPTGKQNSMAAHNPPSLIFAVVSEGSPQNLANAFVQPARADNNGDLVEHSIRKLDGYRGELIAVYGDVAVGAWVAAVGGARLEHLGERVTFEDLVNNVVQQVAVA